MTSPDENILPVATGGIRSSAWTVGEMFAGIGGFNLAMSRSGFRVVWSNQWEPSTKAQHAADCLRRNIELGLLNPHEVVDSDIAKALDDVERGDRDLPPMNVVVGGFPCQDYSVAKSRSRSEGLQGKKGVLWWEVLRLAKLAGPEILVLENVDRLLKSPATQRGRDFAIMLASLAQAGFDAEWRVVNAADYGYPQRRRRVFIVARRHLDGPTGPGILSRALPSMPVVSEYGLLREFVLRDDLADLTLTFGGVTPSPFRNSGSMSNFKVLTQDVASAYVGPRQTLGDILQPHSVVDETFFVPSRQVPEWRRLKAAKSEERVHRSGQKYNYTEGSIAFPDAADQPSRTILTGEGGSSPSRFKHIIEAGQGRYRRLTPLELERLNGFPDNWTAGMSDSRRAFCLGNALVVGVVQAIGAAIAAEFEARESLALLAGMAS